MEISHFITQREGVILGGRVRGSRIAVLAAFHTHLSNTHIQHPGKLLPWAQGEMSGSSFMELL